jgi:hypothetical protein
MEMQRLVVAASAPLLRLSTWYRRHLSLVAWYSRGSSYGNSYLRASLWLGGMLILFKLHWCGKRQSNPPSVSIVAPRNKVCCDRGERHCPSF